MVLSSSEKRFREVINASPDAIIWGDPEGTIKLVNKKALELTGFSAEELIGKTIMNVPVTTQQSKKNIWKAHVKKLKGIDVPPFEIELITKRGEIIPAELSSSSILDGDQLIGTLSILRDLRERKKIEAGLIESEKRYRTLLESITDAVFVFDRDWRLVLINDTAVSRGSRSREEMLGCQIADLFPNIEDSVFHTIHKQVMETRKPAIISDEFTYPSGQRRWYEVHMYPVPEGILCISTDITQRKQIEEALRVSEMRFRELADLLPSGVFEVDLNGNLTYVNRNGLELFGYIREDFEKGINTNQTIVPEEYEKILENRQKIFRGEKVSGLEYTALRKNGTTFPAYVHSSPIMSEGEIVGLRGVIIDITERKKAEVEIGNLARFPSENPNPVLRIRKDGVVLYANDASESWLEKWKSEIGKRLSKRLIRHIVNVLSSGKSKEVEYKHENRVFSFVFTPIVDANYVNIYGRDITEQRKGYEALKESEIRFRELADLLPVGVYELDLESNVKYVNRSGLKLFSYSQEDFDKGLNTVTMMIPKDYTRAQKIKERMISGEEVEGIEYIGIKRDGTTFPMYVLSTLIKRMGKIVGLRGISIDITDRKKMEDKINQYSQHLEELVREKTVDLRESEKLYRSLVETSPEAIMLSTLDGKVINTNLQGAKLFGFESTEAMLATEKTIFDFISSEDLQRALETLKKILEEGKIRGSEFMMIKEDGSSFPAEMSVSLIKDSEGMPQSVIGVLRDLTEHKIIEKLLFKAKRLATIGETAGMVGHDLRNPLQAIVNTIYLANMKLDLLPSELAEKGELKAYLDTVERQVNYMNKIVSDLLDYARPIHPEIMEISMHQLIQGALLSFEIPETIAVSVSVSKKMKMKVDPVLMRRVLINLITNAVQAMPDGGNLTIKASKKAEDVLISVKDTGVGIRKEDLSKLFQPLFTTKSKGQGFGLPVCKRIIDAHGGEITVKTKVGKGSTFTVKLPLRDKNN